MKPRSKATASSIVDRGLEKPLLHLHAANNADSFWDAVQDVIEAALPTCFIGLTLQHNPILPRIAKSTQKLTGSFFPVTAIEKYYNSHPRRNVVFISDFFSDERHFKRSLFYRRCMLPTNGQWAIGLCFRGISSLLPSIAVVRGIQQGSPSAPQMRFSRQFHAEFQTAHPAA